MEAVVLGAKNPPTNAEDAREVDSILGLGRCPGEENGNPLPCSCLGNPVDRGAWRTTVHVAAESDMTEHTWDSQGRGSEHLVKIWLLLMKQWWHKRGQAVGSEA